MLEQKGIPHLFRDTGKQPLTAAEIRGLLRKLKLPAAALLRPQQAKKEGLTGQEPEPELVARMARNPDLIQRPIAVLGNRALLGRPPERVLELSG